MPMMNSSEWETYMKGLPGMIESTANDLLSASQYNEFVEEMSSQDYIIMLRELENAEAAGFWEEGAPRPAITPNEGYVQRLTQRAIGCMIDISKMMKKLSRSELLNMRAKQMNRSMLKFVEYLMTAFPEYGDVATASVPVAGNTPIINNYGADRLPLFSTAHTWLSSDLTYSNKAASYMDLTETAIESVRAIVRLWGDNTGDPYDYELTDVIVHPSMRGKAARVAESQYQPNTANNAVNVARQNGGFIKGKIVELQRLISTTAWYLMTDSDESKIKAYWAWKNESDRDRNVYTGNEAVTLDSCLAVGAHRWRAFKVV